MILDQLENGHEYTLLNEGFAKAFEFLSRPDLKELESDKYEIDGERVFAMVSRGPGKPREEGKLEVHRDYIDIQVVLNGVDDMGWKPLSSCNEPVGDFDAENDYQLFTDTPDSWLSVGHGKFVIFYPKDAHLPMIGEGELHKVVVKVAVEQN